MNQAFVIVMQSFTSNIITGDESCNLKKFIRVSIHRRGILYVDNFTSSSYCVPIAIRSTVDLNRSVTRSGSCDFSLSSTETWKINI